MMEDDAIVRLNIRHYQELLKLDRHTVETRQHLIELLAEAEGQFSFDEVAKSSRDR
jgi:hypothetical protein